MRDDFSDDTKRLLATRSGFRCSRPDCRAQTSGPGETARGSVNLGVAAHITAASPGGPRFDSSLTAEQRRAPDNGIWLCQNDAKLVDSDDISFSVATLRDWKVTAEQLARSEVGRPVPSPVLAEKMADLTEAILANHTPLLADRLRESIEAANPGVKASITFADDSTTYRFRFREGIAELPAGTLTFPDTEAGAEGNRKWRSFREHGSEQVLSTGEFTFSPSFRVPGSERIIRESESASLKIGPAAPPASKTVRIEGIVGGCRTPLIPFTELRVRRAGTVDSELELSGGLLAGRWTMTWPTDRYARMQSHLDFLLPDYPASVSRHLVSLARGLADGADIEIISLETGTPLVGLSPTMPIDAALVEVWEDFLDALITINETFRCDLRFPPRLDDETFDAAWIVATGITLGRAIVVPGEPLTFSGDVPEQLLAAWARGETPTFSFPQGPFELSMARIDIPGVRVICRAAEPEGEVSPRASDARPVQLRCDCLIYDFSRSTPANAVLTSLTL